MNKFLWAGIGAAAMYVYIQWRAKQALAATGSTASANPLNYTMPNGATGNYLP
jgi:hypothetical protein